MRSKVSTGHDRLDEALGGGLPAGSVVVLSAPAGDYVPILLGNFARASSNESRIALLICRSMSSAQAFARIDTEQLRFLVCEPAVSSPNLTSGGDIGNLTALNLQISESLRSYQPSRVVLAILSDVLLRHKLVQTRRWLSDLLARLRSQKITTLAHLNPKMHSAEDVEGIVDLFEGNLEIVETSTDGEQRTILRIKWMHQAEVAEREFPLAELVPEGVTPRRKPLRPPPSNLPVPPTPLVGREKELAEAHQLILRDDVRVVTLTGVGGTGKSRLALELAGKLVDEFPDGSYLIPLATIADPNLVTFTIAGTLGLREESGRSIHEILKEYLSDKQIVLVLDNFEHLLNAAPQISELIAQCPRLKVLVTSRAPLRVRGENEFPVEPLPIPILKGLPQPEVLSRNAAVALFLQRSQAVRLDFVLTKDNARAVAEICVRLDGLPLALELAAARIKLLSPEAMLARLEKRLAFLTGGGRDLPARQQTLRAALDWSYDLLEDGERKLFRRLSVFAGGCTLRAAEAVCASSGDLGMEVLEGFSSLVDKSLIRRQEEDAEPRFVMLETVREYALDQLATSGEASEVRQRHSDFFIVLAGEAEMELMGPRQAVWLERLELEHPNLRAALRWAEEVGDTTRGLHLTGSLWRFWYTRGHLTEGRKWLEAVLARTTGATPERAKSLNGAGVLAHTQGNYSTARALCEQALAIFRQIGDKGGIAASLNNLGLVVGDQGQFSLARALYEESLELSREMNDKPNAAYVLNNLALIAQQRGDFAKASSLFEESLTIKRELGDKRGTATTLLNLGNVARDKGDYFAARPLYEESLVLFRELRETRGVAYSINNLGLVAYGRGDYSQATALFQESVELFRELGDKLGLGASLEGLAGLAAIRGDMGGSVELYEECLNIRVEMGDKEGVAACLEGLAGASCAQGQPERAARLFGAAEALREATGSPIPPEDRGYYERNVAAARALLGEEAFTEAWAAGRTMKFEHIISYALATRSEKT